MMFQRRNLAPSIVDASIDDVGLGPSFDIIYHFMDTKQLAIKHLIYSGISCNLSASRIQFQFAELKLFLPLRVTFFAVLLGTPNSGNRTDNPTDLKLLH